MNDNAKDSVRPTSPLDLLVRRLHDDSSSSALVCELAARELATQAAEIERLQGLLNSGPEFTDTARDALFWVLWHHQGGNSPIGQPIRFALGIGQFDRMSDEKIAAAKRWEALSLTPNFQINRPPAEVNT